MESGQMRKAKLRSRQLKQSSSLRTFFGSEMLGPQGIPGDLAWQAVYDKNENDYENPKFAQLTDIRNFKITAFLTKDHLFSTEINLRN